MFRKVASGLVLACVLVFAFALTTFAAPGTPISNELTETHTVQDLTISTYKFEYDVPSVLVAGEEKTVPVTLMYDQLGDIGYETVRVEVKVTTPEGADLVLMAQDIGGQWHDIAEVGWWGPAEGFPLAPNYNVETDVLATFSHAGRYTITMTLIDLGNSGATIVSEIETVDVIQPLTLSWTDDSEFGTSKVGEIVSVIASASKNTVGNLDRVLYIIEVKKDGVNATNADVEAIVKGDDSAGGSLPAGGVPVGYSAEGFFYFGDLENGFTFSAQEVVTTFEITFKAAGEYTIKAYAVQLPSE